MKVRPLDLVTDRFTHIYPNSHKFKIYYVQSIMQRTRRAMRKSWQREINSFAYNLPFALSLVRSYANYWRNSPSYVANGKASSEHSTKRTSPRREKSLTFFNIKAETCQGSVSSSIRNSPTSRTTNDPSTMKLLLLCFAVLCAVACTVQAQTHRGPVLRPQRPLPPLFRHRFRREPQGALRVDAKQPLSGPDKSPYVDLSYQQRVVDDGRNTFDVHGGARLREGHVSPQAGVGYEHRFDNDVYIRGQGHVHETRPGRFEPTFGAGVGWRFRREAEPYEEQEEQQEAVEEIQS